MGAIAVKKVIIAGFVLSFVLPSFGVDKNADYQRAAGLAAKSRNTVFRKSADAKWLKGNTQFWYKVKTGSDSHEFIFVDAVKATRKLAFDHKRLAESLRAKGIKQADSKKLAFDDLQFEDNGKTLRFKGYGKAWDCDLTSYELTAVKKAAPKTLKPYRVKNAPKPTATNGKEVILTFINDTDNDIQLVWLNGGMPVSYGKIKSAQQRKQHTFGGHLWLVKDSKGEDIAVYQAENEDCKALVSTKPLKKRNNGKRRINSKGPKQGISPDGKREAFIKDHNVWFKNIGGNDEVQLSSDGTEENGYQDRFYWSGDSKKLVAVRRKKGQEHTVYLIESSPKDQLQPKLHSMKYQKPGDVLDTDRPCLFDVENAKQIETDNELYSNPWRISDIRWDGDSKRFTFLYNQRGHQVLRVVGVDAADGKATAVVDETSKTFICYSRKKYYQYIQDSGEIIWMSERDGWNHLYLYDANTGKVKNKITSGKWVVRAVDLVDSKKRQVWFQAGGIIPGQDPYHVHYCRVNFDGSGLTVLTEGDGTHTIKFSPDRKYFIDTWSRVDMPPVNELRKSLDGSLVCKLEKADWSKLLETGWKVPERFVAKGRDGKTDIYGFILRPTNFDQNKSYPIIENIYAGPHSAFVPKNFSEHWRMREMAELGFIVVKMDGMGTSQRSKKFHDVCYKNLADSGFPDRILWIKAAAAKYPYMDISRVGIYGGSAGGQSSAAAVMTHGDFYKVAVADCGCHDNRMDKVWWNEQWMGWPVDESYEANSNSTLAAGLKGKLLLVVGELDRNVDPASTMQVVNALIKADKDFDMLVIPGAGHGAAEGKYGRRRRSDYFIEHLIGH